jgi:hypothetical protein
MTARRVVPYSVAHHEAQAAEVLLAFGQRFGWVASLPVPVERIVEDQFDLRILWEDLDEPPGELILGALQPKTRTICLNERHQDLLLQFIGPYQFTLGHELGHWLYDAGHPDQLSLLSESDAAVFCRQPSQREVLSPGRLREVNANKFAACLLMPAHLIRAAVRQPLGSSVEEVRALAVSWGVSQSALRIRLEELGL